MKKPIIIQAAIKPTETRFTPNSIFPFFIDIKAIIKIATQHKQNIARYGDVVIFVIPKSTNIRAQTIEPKMMIGSCVEILRLSFPTISSDGKNIFFSLSFKINSKV